MADALSDLRHQLDAEPSEALKALDPAAQQQVAELVRAARHRQAAALELAVDQGLGFVPRIARGAVKKALGV